MKTIYHLSFNSIVVTPFVQVIWLPLHSFSPEPFHYVSSQLWLLYQQCVHTHFLTQCSWRLSLVTLAANMLKQPGVMKAWGISWWQELRVDSRIGRGLQGATESSHIEPCSQYRRGDEIWTPFNIPSNNCVDKHHELPSAGMLWHLDN